MSEKGITRRNFVITSAVIGAAVSSAVPFSPKAAFAGNDSFKKINLAECQSLSLPQMAATSNPINDGLKYLQDSVSQIRDTSLRQIGTNYLSNPAPTLLERIPANRDKDDVRNQLVKAGLLEEKFTTSQILPPSNDPYSAPQPVTTAPGSGYMSHHSYPGGLITHLAANVYIARAIVKAYEEVYSYDVNNDIVILAQLLHDFHKPWVFQWQENGESLPEATIAGTGAHHVLSIAQALYAGFAPELVTAMACAHTPASTPKEKEEITGWLKAAAIIAGVDPVKYGVVSSNGMPAGLLDRQEGHITHLGDHDWILSLPAAQAMIASLKDIARRNYGMSEADLSDKKFNSFRNYIFSQASAMKLHNVWANSGSAGLLETVNKIVSA